VPKGVKITSVIARKALEKAQIEEANTLDDVSSTKRETITTQTSVSNDPREVPPYSDELLSRLRNPDKYVKSLKELEGNVWKNSAIAMYGSWKSQTNPQGASQEHYDEEGYIRYPRIPSEFSDVLPNRLSDDPFEKDPTNTSDEEITSICQSSKHQTSSYHLNAIRMCRNVILRTFLNLKLLQQSDYSSGCFSIIILEKSRHNVAKMVSIDDTDFIALVYEIEYILRDCLSLVLNSGGSANQLNIDRQLELLTTPMVERYCESLLQMDPRSSKLPVLGVVNILRLLVHMLDLAVASYAGAHCSDFIQENLQTEDSIALLAPFKDWSNKPKRGSLNFRRCNLQCLDQFHLEKPIWMFCSDLCEPSLPLYLSTTIEAFGDIWGPLWKLKDQENPQQYSAYVVGSGSIVQWPYHEPTSPPLYEELFCHWISNEEWEGNTGEGSGRKFSTTYAPFIGTEKLLIGAPTHNSSSVLGQRNLIVNPRCSITISEARSHLREVGRLCIVGATRPYHYTTPTNTKFR